MRYLKFLLIPLLFFLSISSVSALTTETIYADMSNTNVLSNSGKYKNVASNGTISTNSVGTTYQGKSYGMQFFFEETMVATEVYTLKITFMSDDLKTNVNQSYFGISTYVGTNNEQNTATILSLTKNTTSANATWIEIKFIPTVASTKARVLIGSENGPLQITGETTFGIRKVEIGTQSAEGNEQIIVNQNQNTQNIITNQDNNTQDIIDNQNQNTQQQIESQQVCTFYDKTNIITDNKYLSDNGVLSDSNYFGITDYLQIQSTDKLKVLRTYTSGVKACFYNINKSVISCVSLSNFTNDTTIPSNVSFIRVSINKGDNAPQFQICRNGNQAVSDSVNDLNDTIKDDDIGDSVSDAGDFITGFDTNTFGLTSIITAPLNLIQTLTSSSCSQLELPLPYLNNKKLILPCMTTIYQSTFGTLFTMYQTITFGIIAYWVCVRIFNMVKDFKNPDHDEVEVVDL